MTDAKKICKFLNQSKKETNEMSKNDVTEARGERITELKFTHGPWRVNWDKNHFLFPFVWGGDGYTICSMCGKRKEKTSAQQMLEMLPEAKRIKFIEQYGNSQLLCIDDFQFPDKVKANAAIISAAPEMYNIISGFVDLQADDFSAFHQRYILLVEQAKDILLKARGDAE